MDKVVPVAVAPPPRWAVRTAQAIPLLTLPSGLWRVALVTGVPIGYAAHVPAGGIQLLPWEPYYILGLSVVSELAALLTLGLVRPWGEVVPRWIPFLGGRRVRPLAAVVPACLGAAFITLVCTWAVLRLVLGIGSGLDEIFSPVGRAVLEVCYLPLIAWGPLLFAVTFSYYRRSRKATTNTRPPS
ncbi:hypothetical protein [Microtetraspora sp. NBRC 16547]|uniref:hypothetical protein n=1 Tax=Microtetraspora sp. NBRC 16547 TaxID=3030993 RepID=UPI002554B2D5|nr:hypothetical protein [Microtetraspora sp. NBRC 16547]